MTYAQCKNGSDLKSLPSSISSKTSYDVLERRAGSAGIQRSWSTGEDVSDFVYNVIDVNTATAVCVTAAVGFNRSRSTGEDVTNQVYNVVDVNSTTAVCITSYAGRTTARFRELDITAFASNAIRSYPVQTLVDVAAKYEQTGKG